MTALRNSNNINTNANGRNKIDEVVDEQHVDYFIEEECQTQNVVLDEPYEVTIPQISYKTIKLLKINANLM